ncbi:MAG: PIG-L deacetylase family protein [Acidimicrobiia bacterium]
MLPITFGADHRGPLDILCIGAHSDDIEIGCGGTMLRLLAERPGSRVTWVVLSGNAERQAEARASAARFLAAAGSSEVIVAEFRESFFPYVAAEIKEFFEELKRRGEPDVIFAHHRRDEHQDHRTVAELTWNTFRNHLIAEYEIVKYEGDLGHPNLYVPIDVETAERKVSLLLEGFPTQRERSWFRPETFRGVMAVRAVECNAPSGMAEAFHVRKMVI